jgi:hypothetical protein
MVHSASSVPFTCPTRGITNVVLAVTCVVCCVRQLAVPSRILVDVAGGTRERFLSTWLWLLVEGFIKRSIFALLKLCVQIHRTRKVLLLTISLAKELEKIDHFSLLFFLDVRRERERKRLAISLHVTWMDLLHREISHAENTYSS